MASLKPGACIGIIGGGQLGRMLALAAARLGLKTLVLDPQENAPAFQVSNGAIIAAYDDGDALSKLAAQSDVITYEFENIDLTAVKALEETHVCHPNSKALATSQDRLVEKSFFNDLGIETAPFFEVSSRDELNEALKQTGGFGIVKSRRFGYDGKGQIRLSPDDTVALEQANELIQKTPCILEGFVNFEREISIVAARNSDGQTELFEVAENVHVDGILSTSTLPARVGEATRARAQAIAVQTLDALKYVGVLAIEFFVNENGDLLVNEFAPRVHNSGHWTEAACVISQFEQHIRAVSGLPLISTHRHSDCIMENLIGEDVYRVPEILTRPDTLLHLYGKEEVRTGRKMGHFTTLFPTKD